MHRLSDDLARTRLLYPSPLITAPTVLIIDIPIVNRGSGLTLGRYYPIVLETEQEIDEIEHFLAQPRHKQVAPDLFNLRPSRTRSDNILISRYDPPISGWPWLQVCRWPNHRETSRLLLAPPMARGCYTIDVFRSEAELNASQMAMIDSLCQRPGIEFQLLAGEAIPPIGRA